MDWQQITSFVIVAVSAFLLVRSEIKKRQRAKKFPCSNSEECGCSSTQVRTVKHYK